MKRILALCVALAAAVALAACSANAPSSSSSSAVQTSSTASSEASSSSSSAEKTEGSTVVIPLDYSAGTGYEWQCSVAPDGIVEQVGQETVSQTDDKEITGGPLRDKFSFQAVAPGEVVLTFDLVRSWEGEPAETQTYAFTVSDDLEMVLNPYKSEFENEPEQASA